MENNSLISGAQCRAEAPYSTARRLSTDDHRAIEDWRRSDNVFKYLYEVQSPSAYKPCVVAYREVGNVFKYLYEDQSPTAYKPCVVAYKEEIVD